MQMRTWRPWSLLFCLLVMLAGCAGVTHPSGDDEIVLAAARDLAPGPHDAFYCSSLLEVWEPLIDADTDGQPKPVLATSWEMSDDARVWIFHLRKGVHFHDGTPFNAQSVVKNFDRIAQGFRTSQFYYMSLDLMYPGLLTWQALDEYTVQLTFDRAMPQLPYLMAGWNSAQFSPQSFDAQGQFVTTAIGTGPFRLQEVRLGSHVLLINNEDYWGTRAKASRIRVRVIPTAETRFSALKAEEIMGVLDLGALTPALATELVKDSRFELETHKMTISHYLFLQGESGVFSDWRLRQAVSLGVDRKALARQYFYGYAVPTGNPINSTSPFGRVREPIYDPEKAKQLAHEVLGERRVSVRFLLSQQGSERYPYKEMAEWIQAEMKPLGLDLDIIILDSAAAAQEIRRGNYDMTLGIRGLSSMDPEDLFWEWLSSGERGTANHGRHFGYSPAKADALLSELATTSSKTERQAVYDELQILAQEYAAVVPLFEDTNILVHNKKIRGYRPRIYGVTLSETEWVR